MSDEHPTTTPTEENQGENSEDWTCIEEKLDALIELVDAVETKLASVETALNQAATKADFSEATETLMSDGERRMNRQDQQAESNRRVPRSASTVDAAYMISFGMVAVFVLVLFIWGTPTGRASRPPTTTGKMTMNMNNREPSETPNRAFSFGKVGRMSYSRAVAEILPSGSCKERCSNSEGRSNEEPRRPKEPPTKRNSRHSAHIIRLR